MTGFLQRLKSVRLMQCAAGRMAPRLRCPLFAYEASARGGSPDVYVLLMNGISDPAQRAAATRAVLAATGDTYQRLTEPARIKWLMLLGDHDDALAALQRIGQDVMFGQDNMWQPAFDPVRNDPRFKAALSRMGLSSVPATAGSRE